MKQRKERKIKTKENKRKEKNENKMFSKLYASWCSNAFSFGEGLAIVFKEQGEVSYRISFGIPVIVEPFALIQDVSPRLNRIYVMRCLDTE